MKPQQKVVTAQDVHSSLYYLHVDSPDDYRLLVDEEVAEHDPGEIRPNSYLASRDIHGIHRKPVPHHSNLGTNSQPDIQPLAKRQFETCACGSNDKLSRSGQPVSLDSKSGNISLDAAPARRLLGPRSMNKRLHPVECPVLHNVSDRLNINVQRRSMEPAARPPKLPARPINEKDVYERTSRMLEGSTFNENQTLKDKRLRTEHCWEWETRRASEAREEMNEIASSWRDSQETFSDEPGPSHDVSLSLIRRYNGEQWNVAKILSRHQGHNVRMTRDKEAAITLDILTAGYCKFVDSWDSNVDSQQPKPAKVSATMSEDSRGAFRRHLQFSQTAMRSHHEPNNESLSSGCYAEQARTSAEHGRQCSYSFRPSINEPSGPKSRSYRNYIFRSPWNGPCEFSTGIAGRSLKCKHSITSMNPVSGPAMVSEPVSELRFNLPSSKVLGAPIAKSPCSNTPRELKRSSVFARSRHRQSTLSHSEDYFHHQDDDVRSKDELEDHLDLSLGQEHAGGGFGGKQAKLGKLIIEATGLQMLDLVVAANMALWWKVYERLT